ncbi:MAG: cytochrome c3 family protein [Elusimicrobiota bacterium]
MKSRMYFFAAKKGWIVAAALVMLLCSTGAAAGGAADKVCLRCHGRPEARGHVEASDLADSVHANTPCASCHTDVGTMPPHVKPSKIECVKCHARQGSEYRTGIHAQARAKGESEAAACQDCHRPAHAIHSRSDPRSSVHPFNLPHTCSRCHANPEMAQRFGFPPDILAAYYSTVHGQALQKSGLVVTAVCSDCHGNHDIRRRSDPASRVNRNHVTQTCGRCHVGIAMTYAESIHGRAFADGKPLAPTCVNCHSAHAIVRAEGSKYRMEVARDCGDCHPKYLESYADTYHGKVTRLGYSQTAKCSDCHGSHNILPPSDPLSTLSPQNKVATCRKCHPNANENFATYIAHTARKDQIQFKIIFLTVLLMSALLIGTFTFFGAHTMLWISRMVSDWRRVSVAEAPQPPAEVFHQRFPLYHRLIHGTVIVSFLGLVFTGMPLKFSQTGWAIFLSHLMGGFEAAGLIHRFCALLTFSYFGLHLAYVARHLATHRDFDLFGPDSMMPRWKDLHDLIGQVKWFLGRGPRPRFDRWTYWEKFDYWAVFWGVSIIGASGLVLWFPEIFARVLPGWIFNVATVIHSDEALLAAGFIFTIHFFHTHLRPGKFPMDDVIFTGRISEEELKAERPEEYERLAAEGRLAEFRRPPPPAEDRPFIRVFGLTAVTLGVTAILLIIYALLTAHHHG